MKFKKIDDLKPGMMIAKSIYSGHGLMLVANKKLTNETIAALKNNNYIGAYIYDETSKYEEFSQIIPDILRIQGEIAIEDVNVDAIMYISNKIVNELLKNKKNLVIELDQLCIYDQNTYEHSMNVALTSATCGIVMGLSKEQIEELTASAMMHDIGKTCISKDILNKPGPLTDPEKKMMDLHPSLGYDLLYKYNEIVPEIRTGILCHHENWDGTGYPRGLIGSNIPLYARIIHVADVYDALLRKRSYKGHISQSECIEYLMGGCGALFDPEIVQSFIKFIAIYPLGTEVVLSNGKVGTVIKNNNQFINRPTILIDNKKIDLSNRKHLNLTIIDEVENIKEQEQLKKEEICKE